jgi:hypothetical protein
MLDPGRLAGLYGREVRVVEVAGRTAVVIGAPLEGAAK